MTKERITITINKELLSWLDKRIQEKIFANRSHGFEYLIKKAENEGKKKWNLQIKWGRFQNEIFKKQKNSNKDWRSMENL